MRCVLACVIFMAVSVAGDKPNNGYIVNRKSGTSYRVMYQSQPWEAARRSCERVGAKLAVPKSEEEFTFIQNLVRGMSLQHVSGSDYHLLVWLGISNLDNYSTWKTIDGENLEDTGFSRWAGDNGNGFSDSPAEPHCVGLDAYNDGFREYWCSRRQPYLCQIDY